MLFSIPNVYVNLEGWDAADAVTEGWDELRIRNLLKEVVPYTDCVLHDHIRA